MIENDERLQQTWEASGDLYRALASIARKSSRSIRAIMRSSPMGRWMKSESSKPRLTNVSGCGSWQPPLTLWARRRLAGKAKD